jgi:hypothetical protein
MDGEFVAMEQKLKRSLKPVAEHQTLLSNSC